MNLLEGKEESNTEDSKKPPYDEKEKIYFIMEIIYPNKQMKCYTKKF